MFFVSNFSVWAALRSENRSDVYKHHHRGPSHFYGKLVSDLCQMNVDECYGRKVFGLR